MTHVTGNRLYIGAALCALLAGTSAAGAATEREKNLVIFNGKDGSTPLGGLVADAHGNLYGTTPYANGNNNTYNCGNVFELSHTKGGWKETVLYNFTCGADGGAPFAGLVFDAAGNLYGTTYVGGQGQCVVGAPGCGVVFELSPSGGTWQEKVLFTFVVGQVKGVQPVGGLVIDQAGNLYGTTYAPGVSGALHAGGKAIHPGQRPTYWGCSDPGCGGTVFELSPTQSGGWQEQDIYAFTGGSDGGVPEDNLIFDSAGNLYGTTLYGGNTDCPGNFGCGVVFEVSPGQSGWSESVLHTFSGADGAASQSSLILDSHGDLYGTTAYGGSGNCNVLYQPAGCGTVFGLKPEKSGWKESVLYSFNGADDGGFPLAGVIMDAQGDLLGTTYQGGSQHEGVAFKLAPSGHSWKESVLYAFSYPNASQPAAPLLAMPHGRLFGTGINGGSQLYGGVFELISKGGS